MLTRDGESPKAVTNEVYALTNRCERSDPRSNRAGIAIFSTLFAILMRRHSDPTAALHLGCMRSAHAEEITVAAAADLNLRAEGPGCAIRKEDRQQGNAFLRCFGKPVLADSEWRSLRSVLLRRIGYPQKLAAAGQVDKASRCAPMRSDIWCCGCRIARVWILQKLKMDLLLRAIGAAYRDRQSAARAVRPRCDGCAGAFRVEGQGGRKAGVG